MSIELPPVRIVADQLMTEGHPGATGGVLAGLGVLFGMHFAASQVNECLVLIVCADKGCTMVGVGHCGRCGSSQLFGLPTIVCCINGPLRCGIDASFGKVSGTVGLDLVVLRSEEHTSELQSRFDLVC